MLRLLDFRRTRKSLGVLLGAFGQEIARLGQGCRPMGISPRARSFGDPCLDRNLPVILFAVGPARHVQGLPGDVVHLVKTRNVTLIRPYGTRLSPAGVRPCEAKLYADG